MKALRFACLAFGLFGIVSCIDYREDFTIKANGSGSIRSVISIKKELAEDSPEKLKNDLERVFSKCEGLALAEYDVDLGKERRVTDFTITFGHVEDLKKALEHGGDAGVLKYFGSFEAEKREDRYTMKRTVHMNQEVADDGGLAKFFKTKLMEDSHLVYRMHFPAEVIKSNGEISNGKKTVEWTYAISTALKGPLVMTADIRRPPVEQWLYIGGGVLASLVFLVGAVIAMRRRRAA